MVISSSQRLLRTIHLLITVCLVGFPVYAKYGGGTGEPDEPYLIGTPEDLNAIGTEPNDWDKHFKLMADIDLAGYAETSFNMIGKFMARPFIGVFDGNGKCISNFNYRVLNATHPGIGLFAEIRGPSQIKNLKLENANVKYWSSSLWCSFYRSKKWLDCWQWRDSSSNE